MPEDGNNFQGETNSDSFLLTDLDLFKISQQTKELWILPNRSATHRAIECLIRQGMNWDNSERILNRIRASIGNADISKSNLTMTEKTLKRWGLSSAKICGIYKILNMTEVNSKNLCSIKEGGSALVQLFKTLEEEDDDVWLYSEYNVLQNLGILLGRTKSLTVREAMRVGHIWSGARSQISYFLWRLKPTGAIKIIEDEELKPWDFWGHDHEDLKMLKESLKSIRSLTSKNEVSDECPEAIPNS